MKLASLKQGGRDGTLIVVSHGLSRAVIAQGIPAQARDMMGMMGFRITINFHGEVVDIAQPTAPDDEF